MNDDKIGSKLSFEFDLSLQHSMEIRELNRTHSQHRPPNCNRHQLNDVLENTRKIKRKFGRALHRFVQLFFDFILEL